MANWYDKIISNPDDLSVVLNAYDYFKLEVDKARPEVNISGRLEKMAASLPGITEYRFAQLQELEAILEFLEIKLRRVRGRKFKYYLESYNRTLTTRDAEKYADSDNEVLDISELINSIAFLRNRYAGIIKALETKGFQINNISRLRASGLEEAIITDVYVPE